MTMISSLPSPVIQHQICSYLSDDVKSLMRFANCSSKMQKIVANAHIVWAKRAGELEDTGWTAFHQYKEKVEVVVIEKALKESGDRTAKELREGSLCQSIYLANVIALTAQTSPAWRLMPLAASVFPCLELRYGILEKMEQKRLYKTYRTIEGISIGVLAASAISLYFTDLRIGIPSAAITFLSHADANSYSPTNYSKAIEKHPYSDKYYKENTRSTIISNSLIALVYSTNHYWRITMLVADNLPHAADYFIPEKKQHWKRAVKILAVGCMAVGAVATIYNDPLVGIMCVAINRKIFWRAAHSHTHVKKVSHLIVIANQLSRLEILDPNFSRKGLMNTLRGAAATVCRCFVKVLTGPMHHIQNLQKHR